MIGETMKANKEVKDNEPAEQDSFYEIYIDMNSTGRVFEGIGGISSNGMSKLLMDYDKAQINDIMDLLFKPNFGAGLQHLKIEIGSDANTSSGTEPSHMRSEEDFDITRGYGLAIAKKAVEINPDIYLDALRWGTPRWITDDEKKLKFYINFLEGARSTYGLEFDYLGPDINEGEFSRDWTVDTLRTGLDKAGFQDIKLVASDSDKGWEIADDAAKDPKLFKALHALGVHYMHESTEAALSSGKPLWLSEGLAPFRHSFIQGPLDTALRIIKMYAAGKMVKYEIHPLIEAEYENTPFNYKGIIAASWPWSGHYKVEAGLWVIAHFTQFAKPGWRYMDSGCICDEDGGCVTLKAPKSLDFSTIIINKSSEPKEYIFKISGEWASADIHVWRTNEEELFVNIGVIKTATDIFKFTAEPFTVYSLTTTTGQQKGCPKHSIPEDTHFELPYMEDFQQYEPGQLPKYTSDQGGAFQVEKDDMNNYLCQVITMDTKPEDWTYRKTPEPYTLLGSLEWTNYTAAVDFTFEQEDGYVFLGGRVNHTEKSNTMPQGYLLIVGQHGHWKLKKHDEILADGCCEDFSANSWNRAKLSFHGKHIQAFLNEQEIVHVMDGSLASGQIALGCGYHKTRYRNLVIDEFDKDIAAFCVRFNDRDSRIFFSEGWSEESGNYNSFARSLKKAAEKNEFMELDFEGTAISIIGKTAEDCGLADIYIDGAFEVVIDVYSETARFRRALFTKRGLKPGPHNLKLVVKGCDSKEAHSAAIYIDAVEIEGRDGLIYKHEEGGNI